MTTPVPTLPDPTGHDVLRISDGSDVVVTVRRVDHDWWQVSGQSLSKGVEDAARAPVTWEHVEFWVSALARRLEAGSLGPWVAGEAGAVVPVTLTREIARALTEDVKANARALWGNLLALYEGKAHVALGYDSWADYFAAEFGQGSSQAYRVLDAARVQRMLDQSPVGEQVTERVARELVTVMRTQPEAVHEVMAKAQERAGDGPVTAAVVRQVVQERREPEPACVTLEEAVDQVDQDNEAEQLVAVGEGRRGWKPGDTSPEGSVLETVPRTTDVPRALAAASQRIRETDSGAAEADRAARFARGMKVHGQALESLRAAEWSEGLDASDVTVMRAQLVIVQQWVDEWRKALDRPGLRVLGGDR